MLQTNKLECLSWTSFFILVLDFQIKLEPAIECPTLSLSFWL
jgi:hypothetical protein